MLCCHNCNSIPLKSANCRNLLFWAWPKSFKKRRPDTVSLFWSQSRKFFSASPSKSSWKMMFTFLLNPGARVERCWVFYYDTQSEPEENASFLLLEGILAMTPLCLKLYSVSSEITFYRLCLRLSSLFSLVTDSSELDRRVSVNSKYHLTPSRSSRSHNAISFLSLVMSKCSFFIFQASSIDLITQRIP